MARAGGRSLDIVKKGYAWRADGNVCAVRAWPCGYWSYPDQVLHAKAVHIGSELLTAELRWVYLDANWSF
jgi:hypothetical protein